MEANYDLIIKEQLLNMTIHIQTIRQENNRLRKSLQITQQRLASLKSFEILNQKLQSKCDQLQKEKEQLQEVIMSHKNMQNLLKTLEINNQNYRQTIKQIKSENLKLSQQVEGLKSENEEMKKEKIQNFDTAEKLTIANKNNPNNSVNNLVNNSVNNSVNNLVNSSGNNLVNNSVNNLVNNSGNNLVNNSGNNLMYDSIDSAVDNINKIDPDLSNKIYKIFDKLKRLNYEIYHPDVGLFTEYTERQYRDIILTLQQELEDSRRTKQLLLKERNEYKLKNEKFSQEINFLKLKINQQQK
ncbi:hypothetical protein TRFO_08965 [Tritrichomonas foetus]|uniref:Uncharacterized protein n=1 Tax=Tritrichomonas foetus TaxID=1144522 RepID=A0A1J4JI48_9EUKA|nr:hypothetical protein TRFO_08965 [Tritrichomonas foetus]|eukprot:OHS98369.1 hypothetical protein TRFO_08965 [Tritrichomonas foetus]